MEKSDPQKLKRKAFKRYIFEGFSYVCAAGSIAFAILLFYGDNFIYKLITAIVFAVLFVAFRALLKSHLQAEGIKRKSQSWIFFDGLKVFILLILVSGILGVFIILTKSDCGVCAVYQAVGLAIIIVWACAFLSYFVWAVHFYNINLGVTEGGWKKITEAKNRKDSGESYSVEDIDAEPKYNPYKDQTFGLPGGTVRGMIAFTLLFGAIAMLIVSIGMENQLDANSMFWDQYEFFKTAFLMMIAFYFGSRSLQYLQGRNNPVVPGNSNNKQKESNDQTAVSTPPTESQVQELPVLNPMENPAVEATKPVEKEPEPGESTFDPMKPSA